MQFNLNMIKHENIFIRFVDENLNEEDNDKVKPDKGVSELLHYIIFHPKSLILVGFCLLLTFIIAYQSKFSPHTHHMSDSFHDSVPYLRNPIKSQPIESLQAPDSTPFPRKENVKPENSLPFEGCLIDLPEFDTRPHIVPPPPGPVTLVCCNTTKGILNIEVHPSWAPLGAERFLLMVKEKFFSTKVPLFRALKNFLVQFGLAGDPKVQKAYHRLGNLQDDPSWLPLGPSGRKINKISRFQKGYLAYAGAGKNSRGTQLIMAFQNNEFLGGGSPWEVPFGQIFGENSFKTLSQIFTGYGEKPSQGKIMNRGSNYTQEEFPLMDYITSCFVTRENVPFQNHFFDKPN